MRKKIRELREKKSWSQDHLAEAAGVSLRTIQRAENGKRISKETLLNLAAALDVPVAELNEFEIEIKFRILKLLLSLTIIISLLISWLLYGKELDTQNQYFIDYKIYLMVLSFTSGIAWGVGHAWYMHQKEVSMRIIIQFIIGIFVLFVAFNLMPFIKYPHDQYSAAFPWLATGLMPMVISWFCLSLIQGDLKKILTYFHILSS